MGHATIETALELGWEFSGVTTPLHSLRSQRSFIFARPDLGLTVMDSGCFTVIKCIGQSTRVNGPPRLHPCCGFAEMVFSA